jgi:hypothetical protein
MEYKINISDNERYIIVKVNGEMDPKIAIQYTEESHEIGRNKGIDKYLVDLTEARNTMRVFDNYEFAHEKVAPNPGINKQAKVAFLVSATDHSHDFIETVMINSGMQVKLFRRMDLAMHYLGV